MNDQWMPLMAPCPVVEFHDVRTEKFRSDRYLAMLDERLAGPLLSAGVTDLGQFRVDNHPDRLILLRGYPSMPARRRALTAFHASPHWAASRAEATNLTRKSEVTLTRAVAPADGLKPLRAAEPVLALVSELKFQEQIGNYHLWLRLFLRKAGLDPIAAFATLEAINDVPAVPVVRHRSQHIALLQPSRPDGKVPLLPAELRAMLRYAPEALRLTPALALVW